MKLLFFIGVAVSAAYAVATDCNVSLSSRITPNGQNSIYSCCGTGPFLRLYRNGEPLDRGPTKVTDCDNVTILNSIDNDGTLIVCSGSLIVPENGTLWHHLCDNITSIHSFNGTKTPPNDSTTDGCAARLLKNYTVGEKTTTYSCCAEGTPTVLYFQLKNGTQLRRAIPRRITSCDVDYIPNSIEYDGTVVTCFSGMTEEEFCNQTLIHHYSGGSSERPTNTPTNPIRTDSSIDIAATERTDQISDPSSTQTDQISDPSFTPTYSQPMSLPAIIGIVTTIVATFVFLVTGVSIVMCCWYRCRLCNNTLNPYIAPTTTNISTHSFPSTTSLSVECKQDSMTEKEENAQVVTTICNYGGRSQPMPVHHRGPNIKQDQHDLLPILLPHNESVEKQLTVELQFNKDPSSLNQEACAIEMEIADHQPQSPLPEIETGSKRFILDQVTVYESEMKDSPSNQDDSGQTGEWSNKSANSGSRESSPPSPILRRTNSHPMEEEYKDTENGNTVHVAQNGVLLSVNVDCLEHTTV